MQGPRRRTLLVVGEAAGDLGAIRTALEGLRMAYDVEGEKTGDGALARLRTADPDCVLVDEAIEGLEAPAFVRALREGGIHKPVVLLLADAGDDVARDVRRRGAQDYVEKAALSGPELARAVENAISAFHVQRELEAQREKLQLRNRHLELLREEMQAKLGELADAQKSRDRFLAVMSHEMRTPLNAILGYTDLMDMGLEGDLTPGQRDQLNRIRVGGRHLLDLINDVLDLARADARSLDMDIRPVDLQAVLEEVLSLLSGQAAKKGIDLTLEPAGIDAPYVEADLQRLRQIMVNLVGNAIKFTEAGSVVVRYDAAPDGGVRVRVIDTGIGIDPEAMPRIFDEFFQGNDNLTREQGGSGLGLAISQRLARLMGGEITAESEAGDGSVFTVVLRRSESGSTLREEDVQGHATRKRPAAPLAAAGAVPPQPTVAVVAFGDDERTLADLERQVHPGVRLFWTTDAGAVPELAVREGAVLVVLEVSSSEGAAWGVASAVQQTEALADTAVLLLPAIPPVSVAAADEGIDLGWVSLVPKPFSPGQLTRAVSTALHGHEEEEGKEDIGAVDVLIIDDDEDSRRVAAGILIEAGTNVREAPDGETALQAMRQQPPDVVVLDLMMPVLDGFGVLATMRADPLLARIPVVVLTAKSLTEAERQFLARTAARVLQKGEHRLADVAALVLKAAARAPR